MMNIWILTIGSSNVQLKTKKNWTTLSRNVRSQLDDRGFQPSDDQEKRFRVPSRVMGVVYSQPEAAQYFDDLTFPLIDNFIGKLKAQAISIDRVILVLSDQSIFSKAERSSQHHPYWEDTCELQGLLEKYIKSQLTESSANLHFQDPPLILKAQSTAKGLDDWDEVLVLLRPQISSLSFPKDSTIYVSHQAGTPAISSAVQFCSLAQFGDRVSFLVSSEYKPELTGFVESSSYLRGIQREQAKKLLENYDYAGVNQLVGEYLDPEDKILLDAARQWNVARFHSSPESENNSQDLSFLGLLEQHPDFVSEVLARTKIENWWWVAYEEAYLAVIREKQDNIVEAFFHSFRAFEGAFASWGHRYFQQHIEVVKGIPYLSPSILIDTENSFSKVSGKKAKKAISDIKSKLELLSQKTQGADVKIAKDERVEMNLRNLCNLFKSIRYADYNQNCPALKIFWDNDDNQNISEKRNLIIHQVQGMNEFDLWSFWSVTSLEDWKNRLLQFLNFIVKEDFPKGFTTLEEASLMVKVHQELVEAIKNL